MGSDFTNLCVLPLSSFDCSIDAGAAVPTPVSLCRGTDSSMPGAAARGAEGTPESFSSFSTSVTPEKGKHTQVLMVWLAVVSSG